MSLSAIGIKLERQWVDTRLERCDDALGQISQNIVYVYVCPGGIFSAYAPVELGLYVLSLQHDHGYIFRQSVTTIGMLGTILWRSPAGSRVYPIHRGLLCPVGMILDRWRLKMVVQKKVPRGKGRINS